MTTHRQQAEALFRPAAPKQAAPSPFEIVRRTAKAARSIDKPVREYGSASAAVSKGILPRVPVGRGKG